MHIAQHIADIVVIRRRLSRARTLLQAKQRYVRALQGAVRCREMSWDVVRCREMSWDVSCGISCMVIWRRSDMPCRSLSQDILEMLKKAPSGGRCDCESAFQISRDREIEDFEWRFYWFLPPFAANLMVEIVWNCHNLDRNPYPFAFLSFSVSMSMPPSRRIVFKLPEDRLTSAMIWHVTPSAGLGLAA